MIDKMGKMDSIKNHVQKITFHNSQKGEKQAIPTVSANSNKRRNITLYFVPCFTFLWAFCPPKSPRLYFLNFDVELWLLLAPFKTPAIPEKSCEKPNNNYAKTTGYIVVIVGLWWAFTRPWA